jgi:hypothetical protein
MRVFDVFLRTKTAVRSGKMPAMLAESCRVSALGVQAGGPDLKRDSIQWGVPPVLRFWGPGGRRAEPPETHPIGQLPTSAPRCSLRFDFHGPAHPRLMHCENTLVANPSAVKSESPIPGPQRRGTGGTLVRIRKSYRDRGHPPIAESLAAVVPRQTAEAIYNHFHQTQPTT